MVRKHALLKQTFNQSSARDRNPRIPSPHIQSH
jgi:hypothetical protein